MNQADESILAILADGNGFVSGEDICVRLDMSRAAVWKHVKALRAMGYGIDSSPGRGYRLLTAPDTPFPCEVRKFLTTECLGRRVEYSAEVDSTNLQMGVRARSGAEEGMLLVADSQTSGRGRLARKWYSPPGVNLYFSLLLRPGASPADVPQLALVAGLALCQAVEHCCPGILTAIKWPNDVFVNGRKLSGILCDMQAEADLVHHVVIGVGVNVNAAPDSFPAELTRKATSLFAETGRHIRRARLMAAFLNEFEPLYGTWLTSGLATHLSALEARSFQLGTQVTVATGRGRIVGKAVGIGPGGGLLLDCGQGSVREIVCGDVLTN